MAQHTICRNLMGGKIPCLVSLSTGLWFAAMGLALPAIASQTDQAAMQQQVLTQGRLLLGNLRQAREMGLRGDPWAMAYALQEASRMLDQISLTERMLSASQSPDGDRATLRQPQRLLIAPLEERLNVDTPLSGGRRQRLTDFEQFAGFIPLQVLRTEINQASQALNDQPPALGSALLATNQALGHIDWQPGLKPIGWSHARDLVLQGYALTLDSHPGAIDRLILAKRMLRAMPGGNSYARRLATLLRAPTLARGGLRSLVQDLNDKVQVLRSQAERTRLERGTVEPEPGP